jgi:hypothetical protein
LSRRLFAAAPFCLRALRFARKSFSYTLYDKQAVFPLFSFAFAFPPTKNEIIAAFKKAKAAPFQASRPFGAVL